MMLSSSDFSVIHSDNNNSSNEHREILPKELTCVSLRRGKWTVEEERYTEKIISDFENGTLDVPEGTTLRNYLSKVLHCDPMRITKKYTGNSSIGKRTFQPLLKTPENAHLLENSQRELKELRQVWLSRLLLAEQWNNRKMNLMKASIAGHQAQHQGLGGLDGLRSTSPSSASNFNQAMSRFVKGDSRSQSPSNSQQQDQQTSQKIREDQVVQALKPFVNDSSEMITFVNWLKNSLQLLNSSNPSMSDLNGLIAKGDNTIPALYKKILQTVESGNGSNNPVDDVPSSSSTNADNSTLPAPLNVSGFASGSRNSSPSTYEERRGEDYEDDNDQEKVNEAIETATTTDDSISSHEEVRSPSLSPVSSTNTKTTSKATKSTRNKNTPSSSSGKRKVATPPQDVSNAAAPAAVHPGITATSYPQMSPNPFSYAAAASSLFGLHSNYFFGFPPAAAATGGSVPQGLPFTPSVMPPMAHTATAAPTSYPPMIYPSYAEYVNAMNQLHFAQQQPYFPPTMDIGSMIDPTAATADHRKSLSLEERIRAATLRNHVMPIVPDVADYTPYSQEMLPMLPIDRPSKKVKSFNGGAIDYTHTLDAPSEAINNSNVKSGSVVDVNDTNNNSIVSAAEALLGLFNQ